MPPVTPAAGNGAAKSPAPAAPVGPVEIPLHGLLPKLTPPINNLLERPAKPGELLRIPFERLRAQLAAGSVKLSLPELRQFSPEGIFKAGESDQQVEIPLGEILPRLKPEHLARRADQQKISVSDEIGNVFGASGSQVRIVMDNKPVAGKAAIPSSIPTSIPAPAAVRPVAGIAQATSNANEAPQPIAAPKLDPAVGGGKKRGDKTFTLPLMDVATHWTNAGKEDLASMYRHTLEIPVEMVESGLKKGKLAFPWRQFRQFVKVGAGGSLPTIADEQEIELPLAVIAMRFMEDFGFNKPKKKVDVGTDIPDVFDIKRDAAGAPLITTPTPVSVAVPASAPAKAAPTMPTPLRAAPAPLSMPGAPAAPIAMPGAPITPKPAAPIPPNSTSFLSKPMLDFGDIFGQPEKKSWSLQEVAQKCATLRGVAGALIATSDGLLVASAWPGEVKSEAVAAFVPQTYNRMLQYSKELKLGDATNFTFMSDTVPVQIFKSGSSFLTVLGRAGEILPRTELSAVAQRLSQNSPR